MQRTTRRRAFFGGLLAGGVALPLTAAPSEAATTTAWTPRAVRVDRLRAGDLLLGPEGTNVRLAQIGHLPHRRYRLMVTDDRTGHAVPLNPRWDTAGVSGTASFIVIARGVSPQSVRFAAPRVLDAGSPQDQKTALGVRRGTAAHWAEVNPVLGEGELGLELDTMRLKVGDGGATWADLPYLAGSGSGEPTVRSHFVGDDLSLPRPPFAGQIDWLTTVDGVPDGIRNGDWITRVEPLGA